MWNIIRGLDASLTGKKRGADHNPEQKAAEEFLEINYQETIKELEYNQARQRPEGDDEEAVLRFEDFLSILKRKKEYSSPGIDNISYKILKNLKLDILGEVCNQLNNVWHTKRIPEKWRASKLVLIQKPTKDPNDIASKRGIVLMNVFLKIINTFVKDQLYNYAEEQKLFPALSFGYRKGHSAICCVNYVVNTIKEAKTKKQHCIAIFLDISKAFDEVDGQKMLDILNEKGILEGINRWIFEYLKRRKIVITATETTVDRVINKGVPQGCPLSPLLFNLYTADLHQLQEEGIVLTQYADDFSILVLGEGYEIIGKANRFLAKLTRKMENLDLKINPAKCAAINFSKLPDERIKLQIKGENIELQNTYKHLGYTIDRSLTHRKHIETVKTKAEKSINMLKMISSKTSPSDPETLIRIGNAIVRSKLEYGHQIYGSAAQTHRNKIETSLNAYVRVTMRYLRSTPINVMLADSGLSPMANRVEWLTLKEIIKMIHGDNPNNKFLEKAISERKGNGTYLTQLAVEHEDILKQLTSRKDGYREAIRTWKSKRDRVCDEIPGITSKKAEVNQLNWRQSVMEMMTTRYRNFKKIYTDAAKNKEGTAIAALDVEDGENVTEKINPHVSITNAELMTIREAAKMSHTKSYEKTVIVTDSKSACKMIKSKEHATTNHVIRKISKLMDRAEEDKNTICVQWVPSHVGIRWNETVDKLAVRAAEGPQTNTEKLTLDDTLRLAKHTVWNKWREQYKIISEAKGKLHYEFAKDPGKRIWCKDMALTTQEKITLNRIRSNHCKTKDRIGSWGWVTDTDCDLCQEEETLEHTLYHCAKWIIIRMKYDILEKYKPLVEIFKEGKEADLKSLTGFLKEVKCEI